eukprot:2395510-Pyramimonas_sp.AAC.1
MPVCVPVLGRHWGPFLAVLDALQSGKASTYTKTCGMPASLNSWAGTQSLQDGRRGSQDGSRMGLGTILGYVESVGSKPRSRGLQKSHARIPE